MRQRDRKWLRITNFTLSLVVSKWRQRVNNCTEFSVSNSPAACFGGLWPVVLTFHWLDKSVAGCSCIVGGLASFASDVDWSLPSDSAMGRPLGPTPDRGRVSVAAARVALVAGSASAVAGAVAWSVPGDGGVLLRAAGVEAEALVSARSVGWVFGCAASDTGWVLSAASGISAALVSASAVSVVLVSASGLSAALVSARWVGWVFGWAAFEAGWVLSAASGVSVVLVFLVSDRCSVVAVAETAVPSSDVLVLSHHWVVVGWVVELVRSFAEHVSTGTAGRSFTSSGLVVTVSSAGRM